MFITLPLPSWNFVGGGAVIWPSRALPALLPGVLVGRQLRSLRARGAARDARAQQGLAPLWLLGYRLLGLF